MRRTVYLAFGIASTMLAGCASGDGLNSGDSISFSDPLERPCAEAPLTSPIPFRPGSMVGRGPGIVEIRVRYAVNSEGRLENVQVVGVALSEDTRPLAAEQLQDIRQDIPPQIESSWRYEPGIYRGCERSLVWRSYR
jgi:hypothetical protein